jgi:hypothetical protein
MAHLQKAAVKLRRSWQSDPEPLVTIPDNHRARFTMNKDTFRVVTRGPDGKLRIRDYDAPDNLLRMHTQIGVDDCSTDLDLRGKPVFRGLIGPMPEGKNIVRYESPEVFETLTKEWSAVKSGRRRRRANADEG